MISIITITKNNEAGLFRTLSSLDSKLSPEVELIVIDGQSEDNTASVVARYQRHITHFVSERDGGIYDAMNKGARLATGDYLLFLNAGDEIAPNFDFRLFTSLSTSADVFYGDMYIHFPNERRILGFMPYQVSRKQLLNDTVWHPVSFISKHLFFRVGGYDVSLKLAADYDFFCKIFIQHKAKFLHLKTIVSIFYLDGASSTLSNQLLLERVQVQERYFSVSEIKNRNANQWLRNNRWLKFIKRIGNHLIHP